MPCRRPLRPTLCAAVVFGVVALPVVGQEAPVRARASFATAPILPSPFTNPEGLLQALEPLLEENPHDAALLLDGARAWTTLAVIEDENDVRAQALVSAREIATRLVVQRPDDPDAHYWLAAALGLASDQAGGRDKIDLAVAAHEHVRRALELDPEHPGANHILGRLHAGSLRLSFVSRMIARALGLGEILEEASWEDAERRMRIAAEGDPNQLVHLVELGKLLIVTEQQAEGERVLETVASRRPRHLLDVRYVYEARQLLAERIGSR